MNKKAVLSVILLSTLLTGCLDSNPSSSDEQKIPTGFHEYNGEGFSLQIPDEWEVVSSTSFSSAVPKNTIVAFRSNLRSARFTPNVAILKNELSQEITAADYASALKQKIINELANFREIQIEKTNIKIAGKDEETLFIYVEGREGTDKDLKRFVETAGVKGRTAFIAAGALLADDSAAGKGAADKIQRIIRSFEIK